MRWLSVVRELIDGRAIEWRRGAGRPAATRANAVDIIVPVFGAAAELAECLTSVVAETDLDRHRVRLVIDGEQPTQVEAVIRTFVSRLPAVFEVVRNETRRGFVVSANRGMAASSSDVVLLNSDTVVTPRWLEKLTDAAYSNGDVGTVTPLSNNATICSVPLRCTENPIPARLDVRSFAALVESVATRTYPRLPTGVGFCLYIRRALLEDIGYFDEQRFGLGYGEENDFCVRALHRGWLHVADDATFVYHAGGRSFGSRGDAHRRRAQKMLARAHPRYGATIAAFARADAVAPARERIVSALAAAR